MYGKKIKLMQKTLPTQSLSKKEIYILIILNRSYKTGLRKNLFKHINYKTINTQKKYFKKNIKQKANWSVL